MFLLQGQASFLRVLLKINTSELIHSETADSDLLNIKLRWMQMKPEAGRLTAALLINRGVHVIYFSLITAVNPAPADQPPTASLTASPRINDVKL